MKIIQLILDLLASLLSGKGSKRPVEARTGPSKAPWDIPSLELIKEFEGLRLEAYLCPANVWTIGYGHTKTVRKGMKITNAEAEELLKGDIAWVKNCTDSAVKVELSANQVAAVYSFIYNVGAGAFRSSTLLRKLNQGDHEGAANEFKRWNKGGGKVLAGLTRRRAAEAKLFRS